ncbi:xylulokinase [Mycolicibacterium smegmatis]|uniref:Carbohydrate kinase, fggy n=1 Tax=Mycolicibacterium smegmatis (strain MKD8) TaxID=1214915 RepID=A0A2U9PQX3_MYCSE|nr:FGGY family carbohydrate kinase [Mycolicibacterium smegmatis]AWT54192.1 carbohydrate kinase, fggy [Mycolicibacterium smegmatis MKD8]
MTNALTIGIDIGTTNVKASVLDTATSRVIAHAAAEHPLFHPRPGWAEQDPDNYWRAAVACIRQCLDSDSTIADRIVGVAFSGLVGVTLLVDRDGRPVHRAPIWMDGRSDPQCQEIRDRVGEERINWNNGNRVAPWFIEPKALWLKQHAGEEFARGHKLLSPAGYCTMQLTGEFSMNYGDAGLCYPFDYQNNCWNTELAAEIGIPAELYPTLYASTEIVGKVTDKAARETGLAPGTIVVAGGTDISSAALGCGVTEAGQAYYSMGTGSNLGIMIPTPQRIEEFRILKWPHVLPNLTMFDAPMAFTGASLKWFRDMFADPEVVMAERCGQNVFDLVTMQAGRIEPGSDGLMYLPYLGNSLAPRWNTKATGTFFGVQPSTTRAHFVRALIEGVAFDLYSNLRIAEEAGAVVHQLVLNGGPTRSAMWNQITADVTNKPLIVPDIGEAAPLGDAILAATGAGLYNDPTDPLPTLVTTKAVVQPNPQMHARYAAMFDIWDQLYTVLKPVMERHSDLLGSQEFFAGSVMRGAAD